MRAWVLAVALAGCGHGPMEAIDGPNGSGSSDAGIDAPTPPGWTMLISTHWQLSGPGDEQYFCRRMKVPADMWISAFRPLAPAGTHHSVLTIDPTTPQVGSFSCDNATGFDDQSHLLFASGLQTNDLVFPQGIAVHLTAGQYITLNLHLLDSSDVEEMDESGVYVQTVDPSQVTHEVDATFAGTRTIDLKADGTMQSLYGGCSAPEDWHVFALWPHMHQFGMHTKLNITTTANQTTTVLDQPFVLSDEKTYPMNEMIIHQTDAISTVCSYIVPMQTCTYPTGACIPGTCEPDGFCHIPYSESSTGEMCYTALYKYPAGDVPAYGCHH
jgi:hypothetical protein